MNGSIRTIIVDDEIKSRETLTALLANYCPDVNLVGTADSVDTAFKLINRTEINLLLLDVEMPEATGFDLLHRLNKIDFAVIFVTGFDHYALQAIKFHALDYLLKPIDTDELILAVNKVKVQLNKESDSERIEKLLDNFQIENKDKRQIAVVHHDGWDFVAIEDILRFEADGVCTWIFINGGRKILSSKNLGEYQKILPSSDSPFDHRFFRVHHSHIVNLKYVHKYNRWEKCVELKDSSKIPVAQRRYAQFSELLRNRKLL